MMKKVLLLGLLYGSVYAAQPEPMITKEMVSGLVSNAESRKAEIDEIVKLVDTTITMKMVEFRKLNDELLERKRQYDDNAKRINSVMADILKSLKAVEDRAKSMFPMFINRFNELNEFMVTQMKPESKS